VKNTNNSTGDPFADEVKVDLDMLRALVLDEVGGQVDGADIVAEDQGARGQGTLELVEQDGAKPPQPRRWPRRGTRPRRWSGRTGWRFDDQETRLLPRNTA
jgi:hypothetical protein